MATYYLAIDIGASSGRHILGYIEDGKIKIEEIYRFKNGMLNKGGRLVWDVESLFDEVVNGLARAAELGKIPSYMAIDTWGVDYVLTDGDGKRIGESYGYRDQRCERGMRAVFDKISFEELYRRNGIQLLNYNTLYQLMADSLERPEELWRAKRLLMIPDYLGYRLTGIAHNEYTNATTGAIVDIESGEADVGLMKMLGYPTELVGKLSMPGETLGRLLPEIRERVGYDLTVLHTASHDTASAVLAVPCAEGSVAYLSSGTWSLLGAELDRPILSDEAREAGFTHEGGYAKRYRFLTNIMGLWIIQSIRRELGEKYSFSELSAMAEAAGDTGVRINVNDKSLMAPESMLRALEKLIGSDMSLGEMLSVVYHSLADLYAESVKRLGEMIGKAPEALHVIGGGSRDGYLNRLTANRLDIPVFAGPTEATAIGNITVQLLATGALGSVSEARRAVARSFDVCRVKSEKEREI